MDCVSFQNLRLVEQSFSSVHAFCSLQDLIYVRIRGELYEEFGLLPRGSWGLCSPGMLRGYDGR